MKMIKFSEKQKEAIQLPAKNITFELNEGTVRSGKTTADIFKMALFYLNSKDKNHLITAYNQEQAYRMFFDGDGFGLQHIFENCSELKHDAHGDHLLLYLPNGEERKIYYKGGGKSNSVGSIRGLSFGSVVFLEYDLLNLEFIRECLRRTMASDWRYHLAEQNPPAPNHPNLEEFERFKKSNSFLFRHWTAKDNPILTEERKRELEQELSVSEYLYKRDWLGERVMPQGVIYSMFDKDTHITNRINGTIVETFFTADAGQSDATTCSYWAVAFENGKHTLYRMANYYHSGEETGQTKAMSVYAREIKYFIEWCFERWRDFPRWNAIYVDPAAKSLREEMHLINIDTRKADNNSRDQVASNGMKLEVGIERMQNLLHKKLMMLYDVESPYDHYHFIREIGMYTRNHNGLPIDKYNHALDEARYATNYFYKTYIG